jgi:predicted amidohydrolase YtcJ
MDKVETWASKEALKRGVTTPHSVHGFKEGVRAAHEALSKLKAEKKLSFVPGGDEESIWTEFIRG